MDEENKKEEQPHCEYCEKQPAPHECEDGHYCSDCLSCISD
jgi:hypothetical protein